ncbi:MAG TPA: hypothetical protein VFL83_12890 [Anaeromyxobacter sp.]|nr:hypothetical protein [Anaeromyxobacter sp.]
MNPADALELEALSWIVATALACVLAAVVVLLRSGRAVPGPGIGGGAHAGGAVRPLRRPRR